MIIDQLRIVGSSQTNVVMIGELIRVATRALGRRPPAPRKVGTGQLVYPFDPDLAQVAVAYLRTATRVVRDVYQLQSTRLEPLYDELRADIQADQRAWWQPLRRVSVEVRQIGDIGAGPRQVVGAIKNAILDGIGDRGAAMSIDPHDPQLLIVARADDSGHLTLAVDLGLGSLSKRGWRHAGGDAPLREHLAAVLLMLIRYDARRELLFDPMCGSGTIAIESVLAARAQPRPLPEVARLLADRPTPPLFPDTTPLAIGSDLDLEALIAAKANAAAAGVSGDVVWQRGDARRLGPDDIRDIAGERNHAAKNAPGVILFNPPYGQRMGDLDEVFDLYQDVADNLCRFRGWRIGFLTDHPHVLRAFPMRPTIRKPLANANLRSYYYQFEP